MGILISINKTKKKYRVWSTICDGWLTDWDTREATVKYLQFRAKERCRQECKEIEERFPLYYWTKDHKRIIEKPF